MRHALLIAIERYSLLRAQVRSAERSRLGGAINDMERWAALLGGQGFRIRRCYDGWASRQGVLEALESLLETVAENDSVLLAWSGSGSRVRAEDWSRGLRSLLTRRSGRRTRANDDLLEPELTDWLERLEAKTPHITLVFDTCFDRPTGTSLPALRAEIADLDRSEARLFGEPGEPPAPVRRALAGTEDAAEAVAEQDEPPWLVAPGRVARVLAACATDGQALEISDPRHPGRRVGAFSHALLDALATHDFATVPWERIDWPALVVGPVTERLAETSPGQVPSVHGRGAPADAPIAPLGEPGATSARVNTPEKKVPTRKRHALVVGVGRYRHADDLAIAAGSSGQLEGPVNDALRLGRWFEAHDFDTTYLLDEGATRRAIVEALDHLVAVSRAGDSVVFTFSGHGSTAAFPGLGDLQTLVPHDSGRRRAGHENLDLFDIEIDRWVKRLNRQGIHAITLVLDSCHSGGASRGQELTVRRAAGDDPMQVEDDPLADRSQVVAEAANEHAASGVRGAMSPHWVREDERVATVLTACRADQLASEKGDEHGLVQGYFSRFLARALERLEAVEWQAIDWPRLVREDVANDEFRRATGGRQEPQVLVPGRAPSRELPELERHALLIGIERYDESKGLRRLASAVDDATALRDLLVEQHGFAEERVHLLLDDAATAQGIREALAELPKKVGNESAVIVFFAGHGEAQGEVLAGVEGFLMPRDAGIERDGTWIAMSELRQELEALDARHLLVILDCCFAGSFNVRRSAGRSRPLFDSQLRRYLEQRSWQVLTSATHNQLARDVGRRPLARGKSRDRSGAPADEVVHSPFAAALLEGLDGEADAAGDGVITTVDLYQHIDQKLLGVAGGQTPGLSHFDGLSTGQFVFFTPGRELRILPDPAIGDHQLPWPGLAPYGRDDSHLFFGREELVEHLMARLGEGVGAGKDAPRVLALVAASGGGKTSLLQAGLLPRLRDRFDVVELVVEVSRPAARLAETLAAAPRALRPRLVVVDGIEAIFGQVEAAERDAFLAGLTEALEHDRALVTIRSDFVSRLAHREGPGIETFRLPSPRLDELRRIVEGPAEALGLFFEPGLVSTLVEEVGREPWPLPTLSATLDALYRHAWQTRWKAVDAPDRTLRMSDYEAIGRVEAQLDRRADEAYRAEEPTARELVRRIFLRLVDADGGGRSKRRMPRSALWRPVSGEDVGDEPDVAVEALLDRWIARRLLVADDQTVELASNALLEGWGRLGEWLDDDPHLMPLLRDIGRATSLWHSRGRSEEFLWHSDPRLVDLLGERMAYLDRDENAFAEASFVEREGLRLERLPAQLTARDEPRWAQTLAFALELHRSRPRVPKSELALRSCLALTPLSVPLVFDHETLSSPPIAVGFGHAGETPSLVVQEKQHAWVWGLEPERLAAGPEKVRGQLLDVGLGEVGLTTEDFVFKSTKTLTGPAGAVVEIDPKRAAFELRFPDRVPEGFAGAGADTPPWPVYRMLGLSAPAEWVAFEPERQWLAAAVWRARKEPRLELRLWAFAPVIEEPRLVQPMPGVELPLRPGGPGTEEREWLARSRIEEIEWVRRGSERAGMKSRPGRRARSDSEDEYPSRVVATTSAHHPATHRLAVARARLGGARDSATEVGVVVFGRGGQGNQPERKLRCTARAGVELGEPADRAVLQQLVFDPSGRRLAALDGAGRVRLWDLASSRSTPVAELPPTAERSLYLRFSAENTLERVVRDRVGRRVLREHPLDREWLGQLAAVVAGQADPYDPWCELMGEEPMPEPVSLDPAMRIACYRAILGLDPPADPSLETPGSIPAENRSAENRPAENDDNPTNTEGERR